MVDFTCVPPQGCKSTSPILTNLILPSACGGFTDIVLTSSGFSSSILLSITSVVTVWLSSTNKFIFILAGVTSENEGFINKEKLELIERDSSVILVSRAEVLDFEEFINMAEKNNFRAAVDVFPEEPVPSDAFFRKESNILFTSHVAGAMHFSYKNIREMMMDDIRQILKGMPPTRLQRAEPYQAMLRRDR